MIVQTKERCVKDYAQIAELLSEMQQEILHKKYRWVTDLDTLRIYDSQIFDRLSCFDE